MAETINFETQGLQFVIGSPRRIMERLSYSGHGQDKIQDARKKHYGRELQDRSGLEVDALVYPFSWAQWNNPNKSRGKKSARREQIRSKPRVVAALNASTSQLEGFAYGAKNTSSSREPWVPVGWSESFAKMHLPIPYARRHRYAWGSELVNRNDRGGLDVVMGALLIDSFDDDLQGSWYPDDEETRLVAFLELAGYKPDTDKAGQTTYEEVYRYGQFRHPARQAHFVVASTGLAVQNLANIPGADEAISQAHSSLVTL